MAFIVKINESDSNTIVAVIDEDLKGKEIVEGNKILNLNSSFYQGEEKNEEETLNIIKSATHLNVVGKNIIKLLKKENLIETTLEINGVPYAQAIF